jgi:hypothetical protein
MLKTIIEPPYRFKDTKTCVVGDPVADEIGEHSTADEVDALIADDFGERSSC